MSTVKSYSGPTITSIAPLPNSTAKEVLMGMSVSSIIFMLLFLWWHVTYYDRLSLRTSKLRRLAKEAMDGCTGNK